MWTLEDLNYLAGILDGEGSLAIEKMSPCKSRNYHYFTPRLCVINTSKCLMDWLTQTFGGRYNSRKKVEGRKQCYRWHIFGSELETVLRSTMPYMKIKRDLAELIIEFRDSGVKHGRKVDEQLRLYREELYLRSRKRNTVGDQ